MKSNPLPLLLIAMALFVFAAVFAVMADARSLSDIPVYAASAFVLSMVIFAVLFYFYFLVPVWTWLKRWINGEA
jgi:hypothetical protein